MFLCLLGFLWLSEHALLAQLRPLEDQYMLNGLALNPAYAGSEELMSLSFLARNQWTGFDGAPSNFTFGMHTPLKNDKVALGLIVVNDNLGFYNETGVMGNYAYRINLNHSKISLGLAAGIYFNYDDRSKMNAVDNDDIYMLNDMRSHIVPEFSFGAYYYGDRFFVGLSMPSFVYHEYDPDQGKYKISASLSNINYLLYGGYKFGISNSVDILPSSLFKLYPNNTKQLDLNMNFIYKERIWLGLSYRTKEFLIYTVQYQINRQLRLAYSYGSSFSDMAEYNNGTHEVMIKYNFDYLLNLMNPRSF